MTESGVNERGRDDAVSPGNTFIIIMSMMLITVTRIFSYLHNTCVLSSSSVPDPVLSVGHIVKKWSPCSHGCKETM